MTPPPPSFPLLMPLSKAVLPSDSVPSTPHPTKLSLLYILQVNEVADDKAMIRAMQGEIEALKRQLVGGGGWAAGTLRL